MPGGDAHRVDRRADDVARRRDVPADHTSTRPVSSIRPGEVQRAPDGLGRLLARQALGLALLVEQRRRTRSRQRARLPGRRSRCRRASTCWSCRELAGWRARCRRATGCAIFWSTERRRPPSSDADVLGVRERHLQVPQGGLRPDVRDESIVGHDESRSDRRCRAVSPVLIGRTVSRDRRLPDARDVQRPTRTVSRARISSSLVGMT